MCNQRRWEKKSTFSDSRSEQRINTKKANNSELLKNKKAFQRRFMEAEYAVIHGRLHYFFPLTWPVTQSVSLEVSLFLSLPPALTPWISTGKASLSLDNNPNCHPCRHQNSRRDYNIIQGDNPVQSVVKKWGEVSFSNLVDEWTRWEGTANGESVGFHLGTRQLLLFLTGLCSHIKKAKRHSQL